MQATATVEAPRSGRDVIFDKGAEIGLLQPDINLNAPRYFVQMGFDIASVGTHAIPHARMWRGDIVPCRTIAVVDALEAIPETERIPGSERPTGTDGKLSVASRRAYAYHEAEALLGAEDTTDKKSCIFEIKSLYSELGHRLYKELDLTRLFFPDWPRLPERNVDVTAFLRAQVEAVKVVDLTGVPSELQPQIRVILEEIGGELIAATVRTQELQRQEILYTHLCMKLKPNEDRYKPKYDSRDLEILKRTGLPEIDAVDIQTAESLNILANQAAGASGGADSNALLKLAEAQAETNAIMREQGARTDRLIEMLIANSQPAKTKAEPSAPKDTQKGK